MSQTAFLGDRAAGVVKRSLWTMWEDPPLLSGPRNAPTDQGRRLAVNPGPAPFHHRGGDVTVTDTGARLPGRPDTGNAGSFCDEDFCHHRDKQKTLSLPGCPASGPSRPSNARINLTTGF